jgi:hypothetical protein
MSIPVGGMRGQAAVTPLQRRIQLKENDAVRGHGRFNVVR